MLGQWENRTEFTAVLMCKYVYMDRLMGYTDENRLYGSSVGKWVCWNCDWSNSSSSVLYCIDATGAIVHLFATIPWEFNSVDIYIYFRIADFYIAQIRVLFALLWFFIYLGYFIVWINIVIEIMDNCFLVFTFLFMEIYFEII